jgi:glutamate-1-semialdehyde 2,1-aminomutase
VLAEPALTNIGIVLPEPGFHDALRDLTRRTGTLLIIDETHTISAGPGGATKAWGLRPDILTVGKTLGAGIPSAAYGVSSEVSERIYAGTDYENADVGGIGGTLAGNALSLAAMRATLGEVLTDEAFERMIDLGERFEEGVQRVIDARALPWHVTRVGCRVEYLFRAERARNGEEAHAGQDHELDSLIHLYLLNRGILITPFHNMALMSPATTAEDVDRHTEVFSAAVDELVGTG